jgi:hypothetical protein
MPATYDKIQTTTLGSAAATVNLTSISSAYTDLILEANVQASSSGQGLTMQFNGDGGAGSLYSTTILRGNGSTAVSARQSNTNNCLLSNIAEPPTSGSFGLYIANFQSYSNTSVNKTILVRSNSAAFATEAMVGLWRNTNAISSILIGITGGNIASGSTFTLYGIKAA